MCARRQRSLDLAIVALVFAALTAGACTTAPSSADTLDVLDYVLGAPEMWPRFSPLHHQHQNLEGNRVCWTKYTLPWSFECWRWDDSYVYHAVDHAIDGASRRWEHYIFTDGRWMPRKLRIGETWTLELLDNRLTWYDAQCNPQPDRPAPYQVRVWHEGLLDAGGDLGRRDVIVLAYQPNPAGAEPNTEERFYFSKGAGWYRWTRGAAEVTFNLIGGVARAPAPLCARDYQP